MDYYEEIYHHGILGQKWGVRRFQNKDGTRTPAGSRREQRRKHNELRNSTNAKELYKNRSQLSDKELKNRLNRVKMENELRGYAKPGKSNNDTVGSVVRKKVIDYIGGAIGAVAIAALAKRTPMIKETILKFQPGADALKDAWSYAVDNLK